MTRSDARDPFDPGARIGDYDVERVVRMDETGIVYQGVHRILPRRAAVKVLHAGQVGIRSMAVQLLREACVLEALSHPGIPRVYETGVLADKRPWVALELIEGTPLAELIQDGPLGVSDLVVMLRAIAEVLEHAHARGVVHHRLTDQGVLRTPERATPFCLRGWSDVVTHDSSLSADPSSDVHALGVLAFRALTGAAVTGTASARQQCPSAPAELTALVDHMLTADPKQRPIAADVRRRAAWLSETMELAPRPAPQRPATLPPEVAVIAEAPRTSSPEFRIRIHRS